MDEETWADKERATDVCRQVAESDSSQDSALRGTLVCLHTPGEFEEASKDGAMLWRHTQSGWWHRQTRSQEQFQDSLTAAYEVLGIRLRIALHHPENQDEAEIVTMMQAIGAARKRLRGIPIRK
jgi:hypothetical protein